MKYAVRYAQDMPNPHGYPPLWPMRVLPLEDRSPCPVGYHELSEFEYIAITAALVDQASEVSRRVKAEHMAAATKANEPGIDWVQIAAIAGGVIAGAAGAVGVING